MKWDSRGTRLDDRFQVGDNVLGKCEIINFDDSVRFRKKKKVLLDSRAQEGEEKNCTKEYTFVGGCVGA